MATDTESMHALAFLYLTFSHATDGALSGDEMRAVAGKLKEWKPDASLEELGAVLKNTVEEYKGLPSRKEKYEAAAKCAEQLKGTAAPESLQTIVADLASLAEVDGVVSDEEKAFIAQTAQTLGVSSPL